MKFCDENANILEWSSEEIIVKYFNLIDNRIHRYFPDFLIKVKEKNGLIRTKMVEIKPDKQTRSPNKPTKTTRRYIKECETFLINNLKWKAAEQYCKERGWEFMIITEKNLFKNEN